MVQNKKNKIEVAETQILMLMCEKPRLEKIRNELGIILPKEVGE